MFTSFLRRQRHPKTKANRLFTELRVESLENRIALTAGAVGINNLGFDGDNVYAMDENILVFAVDESRQNGTDLNGDGDTLDKVVHLYDGNTKTTTNLGLPSFDEWELNGNLLAISVNEFSQAQTDLNGDGDAYDDVMHVYDIANRTTINLGLQTRGYTPKGNLLAISVSEANQGGTDLNGDGDILDNVLHIYDANNGTTTNLGLAGFTEEIDGHLAAIGVWEFAQGLDLNGDGDASDNVLHVYDASTGTTINLGMDGSRYQLDGNLIATTVNESRQGNLDLNGDGDTFDQILHVYDASDGTMTNLNFDAASFELEENLIAFSAREGGLGGADLNGDGDTFDSVMHVIDLNTGSTSNLGLHGIDPTLQGNILAFTVSEWNQGSLDLNGDGDTFDGVIHVYNASNSTTSNLGLVGQRPLIDENLVAFGVREWLQGQTDLNGDGDPFDDVLHVYNANSGVTTNSELAIDAFDERQMDGKLLAFTVSESNQGGTDLNSDGDVTDDVVHVFDGRSSTVVNLRFDNYLSGFPLDGNLLAFSVPESSQGGTDLNGDGDALDFVVHVVDIDTVLPGVRIEQLIAAVEALNLQNGIENSLDAKLASAQNALCDINENNDVAAINSLQAFVNAVESQTGGKIGEEDAANLLADAQLIIDLLENPIASSI